MSKSKKKAKTPSYGQFIFGSPKRFLTILIVLFVLGAVLIPAVRITFLQGLAALVADLIAILIWPACLVLLYIFLFRRTK